MKNLCHYGCGKEANYYFKWVNKWCCSKHFNSCSEMRRKNKPNLGRTFSEETRIKMGNSRRGRIVSDETKRKISVSQKGKPRKKHTTETKLLIGSKSKLQWTQEKIEKHRKYMLNGGSHYIRSFIDKKKMIEKLKERMNDWQAGYMNTFIKNPSKPQIKLFKLCCEIFPYPILNYRCLNYSIDIAVPSLNLAIEYDGSYWHDKEYDDYRQNKLENEGWKFLRYVDKIPEKDKLFFDFKEIIDV